MDWQSRLAPYGPWGLVVGASEGIGRAFAQRMADAGLNVALVARRLGPLEELSQSLSARHDIEAMAVPIDFAEPKAIAKLAEVTKDIDIGLVVYNAALSIIGPFLDSPSSGHVDEIMVNCVGPATVSHHFGQRFRERDRSGLVLMSSVSGYQGTPWVANYAATKAYNQVLGQGLWDEFGAQGTDVLVCNAGATDTPAYQRSAPRTSGVLQPAVQSPEAVADTALRALGRRPVVVPGMMNRLAATVMSRLIPNRTAIRIMGKNLKSMYSNPES